MCKLLKVLVSIAAWFLIGQVVGQATIPQAPPAKRDFLNYALRHEGDRDRGQVLFLNEQRVACSRCHSTDGTGAKVGPDLFAVGDKLGRREIVESILFPSASIAEGYSASAIRTRSGDGFSGIIKQSTDTWIELAGPDAQRHRVVTADIVEQHVSEVSLMPEGLEGGLTPAEFTDLIEFLVCLKQPFSATMLEHGMPREISSLARPVTLEPFVAPELTFEHPVWFGPVAGEPNTFLVVEHETGRIWRLAKIEGKDVKTLFVDLGQYQKGTRGLLGMALHPNWRSTRKYYFAKHVVTNGAFSTLICERAALPDAVLDSGRPTRVLLELKESTGVHYGGGLQFGPDGLLYVGMGDSGPQEDPQGHGQNTLLFLGKILRIDVDRPDKAKPYGIPPENPFSGQTGFLPEIWAFGFREPWRFSFDSLNGDLWVGDVGQDRYEEVDLVHAGGNYGWNVYEGFELFSTHYRKAGEQYIPPVFAYGRKYGVSVTGGFVYRRDRRSSFYGVYIFGDFESRRIFGLTQENGSLKMIRQVGQSPQRIVSFGRDEHGELFLVGYDGMIYRLNFEQALFE